MKKWWLNFVVLGTLTGCSSLMYYPSKEVFYKKSDLPYSIEDISFPNGMGDQIHAWYFHAKAPKAKILFFHGNAQNLSAHCAMLAWLVDENYDLMIFDYPGYGLSTGNPSPENTAVSGLRAIEKINTIKPELPLFIYGQSLGGHVLQKSLNLYPAKNYKAVFIEASFPSYTSVAASIASSHWLTWLLQPLARVLFSDRWAGDVGQISPVPVYILHGSQDGVIPFDQGEELFAKAKEPKYWKVIQDGQHSNTFLVKKGLYRRYLLEALEKESHSQ